MSIKIKYFSGDYAGRLPGDPENIFLLSCIKGRQGRKLRLPPKPEITGNIGGNCAVYGNFPVQER